MNNKYFLYSASICIVFIFFFFSFIWAADSKNEDSSLIVQTIEKGNSLYKKGMIENAAGAWETALNMIDPEKDPEIYVKTVIRVSEAYQALGYHNRGLSLLQKTLPIVGKSDDRYLIALFLNILADMHLTLGNIDKGIKVLDKALEAARLAEDPYILGDTLNNVGNVFAILGDFENAESAFAECLDIIEFQKDAGLMRVDLLLNIIDVTFRSGNYDDMAAAVEYVINEIYRLEDTHKKAMNLISISLLIRKIGKQGILPGKDVFQIAFETLNEAKKIGEKLGDYRVFSYAQGYIGQMYENKKRFGEALTLTRSAISYAHQGDEPGLLYLWQWQLGRVFEGLNKIDQAASSYINAIETLQSISGELFQGQRGYEDIFSEKVKPVYLDYTKLLLNQASKIPDDKVRQNKLIEAISVMESLKTAELKDFFQDECAAATAESDTSNLEKSPPGTAVIYPIQFQDSLSLLIILSDGIRYFNIAITSEELKTMILEYRNQLQTRAENLYMLNSQKLYNLLIRPIEQDFIDQNVDTLVIAPDGELRMAPLATLHDGKQFLIEKYAIATIPAITLTNYETMFKEDMKILISGLSDGVQGFSPLPGVVGELKDIKEIMDGDTVFINKDHNIENLRIEFLKNPYDIIHMATHGMFGGTAEDSFLLTYDSLLTMNKLEQLINLGRYRKKKVELLTLSACQTALGDERAALGLGGAAVKAGVKSVIATLWYVDDEATSFAIREFYRQLKKPDISKAKALQNAQKNLISQKRYWHPLYWAPFLLIGNWM